MLFKFYRTAINLNIFCFIIEQIVQLWDAGVAATSSYKDGQDADKKIKGVKKQYHSNKNYTYCDLMTDLGLRFSQAT